GWGRVVAFRARGRRRAHRGRGRRLRSRAPPALRGELKPGDPTGRARPPRGPGAARRRAHPRLPSRRGRAPRLRNVALGPAGRPDVSSRAGARLLALLPSVAAAFMLALLAVPLLALVLSTPPGDLIDGLRHPLALSALRLSLLTTSISLGLTLLLGPPLAWWMARHHGPAERIVSTLVQLPIVVPPAVSGLALLLAFGRRGLFGPLLERGGWGLAFPPG